MGPVGELVGVLHGLTPLVGLVAEPESFVATERSVGANAYAVDEDVQRPGGIVRAPVLDTQDPGRDHQAASAGLHPYDARQPVGQFPRVHDIAACDRHLSRLLLVAVTSLAGMNDDNDGNLMGDYQG